VAYITIQKCQKVVAFETIKMPKGVGIRNHQKMPQDSGNFQLHLELKLQAGRQQHYQNEMRGKTRH
jgi:hypothetical protein